MPADARAGERGTLGTPEVMGAQRVSLGRLWWMAFVHHQGVCNPHWTSHCRALHLHMETLTLSTLLPSPLGIAFLYSFLLTRGLKILAAKHCSNWKNSTGKTFCDELHLQLLLTVAGFPSEGGQLAGFKGAAALTWPCKMACW